jgi:tryptophan-rich sensory protein
MFEKALYQCPHCGAAIREQIEDGIEFICLSCDRRFSVMLDPHTRRAGFIELTDREIPEPLYLPRGSLRGLATIAICACSWIMIFIGRDVPSYLFSLILAIIGYYFGFRQKMKAAESRILDASAKVEEPLFLPSGLIRFVLIAGFAGAGFAVWKRGGLADLRYLEFFIILAGLIVGFLYNRLFASADRSAAYVLINHLKGAGVLLCTGALLFLLGTGRHEAHETAALGLSAVISFYFGSRS